ncbi:HD domain-containing protein [Alkalibaculum sp. M08DMB]|uniref:HD domain-containing protein n=1 Tax=Alkalibaculum sporogenes TaxID=2655001 RepID=A0A6A7K9D6_9FIRM|nr:HD domain-containing protein [Alkalibaculum sporogenes]MPW26088.1 HD domain-containing protein [Alkalibaculum sporogenes]
MSYIPSYDRALEILKTYNTEEFLIKHAETVAGIMGYFSKEYDPENEEMWKVVGLLHDLDFEKFPEEHCIKSQEIMKELDLDEKIIHATASHGYKLTVDIEPIHKMEKILYAIDELSGLIGAVAIMRPSKSVADLELKSVKKKYKTLNFAKGCSRDVIERGAKMLDIDLDRLITMTIHAMRSLI